MHREWKGEQFLVISVMIKVHSQIECLQFRTRKMHQVVSSTRARAAMTMFVAVHLATIQPKPCAWNVVLTTIHLLFHQSVRNKMAINSTWRAHLQEIPCGQQRLPRIFCHWQPKWRGLKNYKIGNVSPSVACRRLRREFARSLFPLTASCRLMGQFHWHSVCPQHGYTVPEIGLL